MFFYMNKPHETGHLKTSFHFRKQNLLLHLKLILQNQTQKKSVFIALDASLVSLGAVKFQLIQLIEDNKVRDISYHSRVLNRQEQKHSTLDRELVGIVHALKDFEFLIIESPNPIQIFTNHKVKGNHTPGKNLSVADMISRSFTKAELQLNQLKHKQLPPQINFAISPYQNIPILE